MPKGVPSPETMAARAAAKAEKAMAAAAQAQQNLAAARGEAAPVEGASQPSIPPEGEQLAPPTAEPTENVFASTSKSKWFLAQVGLYEGKPYITFPDDLERSTEAYVRSWWLETKIHRAGGSPLPVDEVPAEA